MLFLVGVLVVSAGWGFRLAVATTLASAAVYVQFHMDTGVGFIPTHPQDALAILIFLPVALLANVLAGQARLRAAEVEQRRREADLAADLARLMLRAGDLRPALDAAGGGWRRCWGSRSRCSSRIPVAASEHQSAIPLRDGDVPLGTLLVPADLPKHMHLSPASAGAFSRGLACRGPRPRGDQRGTGGQQKGTRAVLRPDVRPVLHRRRNPCAAHQPGFGARYSATRRPKYRPSRTPSIIHPDDRNRTRPLVDALARSGGTAQFENRCVRADGAMRWLEWSIVAENGQLYGAARDVTDRRREQDRLREAQRMVEASHAEVSALAEQQAALRRVATLVARGVDPAQVYPGSRR